ncbi:MAG: alpha/beta hydrolase [Bdellovibrionaceae bacterium]|nr:alpha/beta hydrolase [Pseudobdellovibrionaceae bacterium]
MKVYQVENIEIKCRIIGDGPLLLLLHGFGGGVPDWLHVAEALKHKYCVIIPSLSVFFSHREPLSFHDQVRLLTNLVQQLAPSGEKLHIVGASYGGLLSFGLRYKMSSEPLSHTLVNPMPFEPLKNLRSWSLRWILYISRWPGVLSFYGLTPWGKMTFKHFGQIFHMGLRGKKKIHIFNKRKFWIIYKAIKRFLWINATQDWHQWNQICLTDHVPTLVMYSQSDPLFSPMSYLKICGQFKVVKVESLKSKSHIVMVTHPQWVSQLLESHCNQVNTDHEFTKKSVS